MYRFIYPILLVVLFLGISRYTGGETAARAFQAAPNPPPLYDLTNYDSIVATFSRPGITSAEQRAVIRTLSAQPTNQDGIKFLVWMLDVNFAEEQAAGAWAIGIDSMPDENCLAADALVALGPPAASSLMEEYIAFHGKTKFAEWPHHNTTYHVDQQLQPAPVQTASVRLFRIVHTVMRNDQLAAASFNYLRDRTQGLPPDHPTRLAGEEFIRHLRASYHIADWRRVFPNEPYRP